MKNLHMNGSQDDNVPFVIQLIEELKKHEFIASGIMLPLLIGAYKEKENYKGTRYSDFIEHVYNDVVESLYKSGRYLAFRECVASHNFVIEPAIEQPKQCNVVIVYNGIPVIYCEDSSLEKGLVKDVGEMRMFFLDKLLAQTVKYCNFIDTDPNIAEKKEWMCELCESKEKINELSIIKSLIH